MFPFVRRTSTPYTHHLTRSFTVYPINPRALARYRERHGQSGGKSDPADAIALAHVLRTDRHLMGEPRPKLRLSSGLAEIPEISPTQVGQSER
ncbi:IS110 family transposase [Microbacterium aerolatum]|uniref:IS110 family transposase n=1 Tax=Microbacterium aerolatum TaxID=153731 RepID=UPI003558AAB7